MSLFQPSVLLQYLDDLDESRISESFRKFQVIFNNTAKQKNILKSKEEQYQEGFLRDLFVSVLGYTLNPEPEFNLVTEHKNKKNSKKADAAIIYNDNVYAVIELKSTKTVDLDLVESQAFGYKNNQRDCKYVITSNFRKIRFYIENAIDFLEFDLFALSLDDFKLLWLCLSKESILKNLPSIVKSESYIEEENITNELYLHYASFRKGLFENICTLNPQFERGIVIKKTQKLLDRFLFLFFAEDKKLVTHNWTKKILDEWLELKDRFDHSVPLYDEFKRKFGYLNIGYVGRYEEVFGYNGGLFATDEILDQIRIDDALLFNGTKKISSYNFDTEIDVNILGHIFEHSLNEIEKLKEDVDESIQSKTTKKKKEGVFYTPKFITQYIVENTLGSVCKNHWIHLGLESEEFVYIPQKASQKLKDKRKRLSDLLDQYRDWLLNLKIIDPACGSGAFLNQALIFLVNEHSKIDEYKTTLLGGSIKYPDIEKSILDRNLFGVDVNEEAVDIAKLSLWLSTAHRGRKLSSLNENIKCGNSLIEDPEIAGDLAFNWYEEFPSVFEVGGFDVVIGNPPYVATKSISSRDREYFWKEYKEILFSEMDLYELFLYNCTKNILKPDGYLGFITPNSYYTNTSFGLLRNYLLSNTTIKEIMDFPYRFYPFEDVNTETCIIILKKTVTDCYHDIKFKVVDKSKQISNKGLLNVFKSEVEMTQASIANKYNGLIIIYANKLLDKILDNTNRFGDYLELHKGWMSVPSETRVNDLVIKKGTFNGSELKLYPDIYKCVKPYLEGKDIHRYFIDSVDKFVSVLEMDKNTQQWHYSPKIILQRIVGQNKNKIFATIDFNNTIIFPSANLVNLSVANSDLRFFLAITNSSLINYYYNTFYGESNTNLTKTAFENIPIPNISNVKQKIFINEVDLIINSQSRLNDAVEEFKTFLQSKFPQIIITSPLAKWYNLKHHEFFKEFEKQKIRLSLNDQIEWTKFLDLKRKDVFNLIEEIKNIDKRINDLVFRLYKIKNDEVNLIENSN